MLSFFRFRCFFIFVEEPISRHIPENVIQNWCFDSSKISGITWNKLKKNSKKRKNFDYFSEKKIISKKEKAGKLI